MELLGRTGMGIGGTCKTWVELDDGLLPLQELRLRALGQGVMLCRTLGTIVGLLDAWHRG